MSGFELSAFANQPVRIKSTGETGITTGVEITHRLENPCSLKGGTWVEVWEVGVLLPGGRVAVVLAADTEPLPAEPPGPVTTFEEFLTGRTATKALFDALLLLECQAGIVTTDKHARMADLRERLDALNTRLSAWWRRNWRAYHHLLPQDARRSDRDAITTAMQQRREV